MNTQNQWFLLENEHDYELASARYETIKYALKESDDYKEKMLLIHLIQKYEADYWDLPEVDPIETIKIRMEEFDLKPSDLAKDYGDKGNLSKVFNYQRGLTLSMIRQFSATLKIPIELLVKEYKLKV